GSRVIADVTSYIRETFELGALGTGRHRFYERLGWLTARGRSFVRTPEGLRPTPDEDGYILLLPTPAAPELDLTAPISCDWRAGLISRRRRATARLSHLEAEPLREAAAWLVGYREYWEESYERLDALLSTLDRREASASTSRSRPGTSAKPKRKGVPDGQDQS